MQVGFDYSNEKMFFMLSLYRIVLNVAIFKQKYISVNHFVFLTEH